MEMDWTHLRKPAGAIERDKKDNRRGNIRGGKDLERG
jgi:hypothetical protein